MVGSHTTVLDRDGGLRKWGLLSSNFDPSSSSSSTLAVLVIHYSSYSHSFSWGKRGHFSDPKTRSSTHHDEARPTSQLSELWSPLESQGWKPYVESNKPIVVAKILNATPVIPYLELNPVWRDSSSFMYYGLAIRETKIKAAPVHASAYWYLDNVLHVLQILVST
ncbi:hypothetical protein JHK87_048030 [Glycine soja]|nr:hypothetical protein JHK87_048030 [Glycine soja]